ncbi:MAG: GNAT family N-acetyltransferase [Flavobacteriales bacterium]
MRCTFGPGHKPTTMQTTIRPARPDDMEDLIALCAEHAAYERTDYLPEGKAQALSAMLFAPDARLLCLVAEEGNALIGYASFSVEVSTWDADRYMHMDCLFLRPIARNKRVGRQLMAAIAQRALALGVTRMQWQTPSFNADAIRFYDRMRPLKKEKVRLFLAEAEVRELANG